MIAIHREIKLTLNANLQPVQGGDPGKGDVADPAITGIPNGTSGLLLDATERWGI